MDVRGNGALTLSRQKLIADNYVPMICERCDEMAVVKCTKCGKVFNTDGVALKPIGDGAYLECCPNCGSTSVYSVDEFQSDDDRRWESY